MARAPKTTNNPPTIVTDADTPGLPAMKEAADIMAKVELAYTEDRDLLNQLIGQIQMTDAISKLTTVVGLTKLKHIKETKLYRALAGKKGVDRDGNEIADVGTFEGFCLAIGSTRQKVDEDLLNLRVFGEEAMDNLARIGAGYRELRQLRKLPEDQQTALIEVAKLGDKESFIELAEEIIIKHAKEKESLTAENVDLKADHEALGKVVEDKNKKLDQLEKQIKKSATQPWDAQVPKLNEEINMVFDVIMECADKLLSIKDVMLDASFENDRDQAATKMLALNYFDRTQRMVEAVALVQQVACEDFDCYINAAKRALITE